MEFRIRMSSTMIKRLESLRRGGGNALQAFEHASSIINEAREGVCSPRQIGRLTRYGDARIPKCVKFDLVKGYRLLAVLGKREISFLFVGSHDECDHWVKNNAGLELSEDDKMPVLFEAVKRMDVDGLSSQPREPDAEMETDDYDALVLRDLTDSDLRKIFSGLCAGRS